MPVPIKANTFRPKLCALAIVRYGRRSKVFWLITCCCLLYIVFHGVFCMSVAEPQRDLGAQASPSRTRSPDHEVAAQTLVDDPRMTTPPPATDVRMATPAPTADAGAQGFAGGVRASTTPPVIDVDPISVMPGGMDEDLVGDPVQIEQAPKDLGTSGAQVPNSSSSGPSLRSAQWHSLAGGNLRR
jgi:hypothetical protein